MSQTKQKNKTRSKSGGERRYASRSNSKERSRAEQLAMQEKELKERKKQSLWEVAQWLLLLALVFCAACLFLGDTMGVIGAGVQKFFLGLVGISAYPLLIGGIFAFLFKMIKPEYKLFGKVLAFLGFLTVFSTFFHLINGSAMYSTADAYQKATPFTGGIVGFWLGSLLVSLVNVVGAYILVVGIGILMIGLFVGVSVKKVMRQKADQEAEHLRQLREQHEAKRLEASKAQAQTPVQTTEKQRPRVRSYTESEDDTDTVDDRNYRVMPDNTHGPRAPKKDGVLDLPLSGVRGHKTIVHTDEEEQNSAHTLSRKQAEKPVQQTLPDEPQRVIHRAHPVETESKGAYVTTKGKYVFPSFNLLKLPENRTARSSKQDLYKSAQKLEDALLSFGVEATVTQVNRGPSVTRYEVMPKTGVKVKSITNLADDIALTLAAKSIRIEAPIPGKSVVGIEIPNEEQGTVYLREILESSAFKTAKSRITVALGKSIDGAIEITDLAKMPHLLIAGATGSGKSVCINSFIISILYKATPEEVQMVMIDPKVVELSVYNGIPHLCTEERKVITDPKQAAVVLNRMVIEMVDRYDKFRDQNVRDFNGYNEKAASSEGELKPMPQIVIIIDELADLMLAAAKSVEDSINRLAAMARAAGMHLVIATQRPSVDVITGTIKANIPSRLAFAVSSGIDSKTILDTVGAERLLGRGDMLFSPMSDMGFKRIQGTYVSDAEVESVVEAVRKYASPDNLVSIPVASSGSSSEGAGSDGGDGEDEFYRDAVEYVIATQRVTVSTIQRRFHIGFNRACNLVERMEEEGIVSPANAQGKRAVLVQGTGE